MNLKNTAGLSVLLLAAAACGSEEKDDGAAATMKGTIALASVVIDTSGNRTTYVQTVESLEDGPFDNSKAIEIPGHNIVLAHPPHLFVGLVEEPTWRRYTLQEGGGIKASGSLSFINLGVHALDYGNVVVDDQTVVSVIGELAKAVIWNPTTMEIRGEVSLQHMVKPGYSLETWTMTTHGGIVYIPGRWADWTKGEIVDGVSITILDPAKMEVVGVAEDDRCTSGGQVVFDEAGYGYVLGDGRNWCSQMYARLAGEEPQATCLLRIPPGGTDFEEDYYHSIPALTGGLDAIGEMETAEQGSGIGFSKMFYEELLPPGVEPVDFGFWTVPSHKVWRIVLGDPPVAEEVQGIPFATLGFSGSRFHGKLYTGESPDGVISEVYEIDPATNTAKLAFVMDGYFTGLFDLAAHH